MAWFKSGTFSRRCSGIVAKSSVELLRHFLMLIEEDSAADDERGCLLQSSSGQRKKSKLRLLKPGEILPGGLRRFA